MMFKQLKLSKMPLKSTLQSFVSASGASQLPLFSDSDTINPDVIFSQEPEQLITSVVMGFVGIFLNRMLDRMREKRKERKARKNKR